MTIRRPFYAALVGLTFTAVCANGATDRLTVFISDLHFGVGKARGDWHAIEDFRWGEEFTSFLNAVDAEGQGKTNLVLNGDSFELWQSLSQNDCATGRSKDESCTDREALTRLEPILNAHRTELLLLREFATRGTNRVFFVPGNHDAALLYPAVASRVLSYIGAPAERVQILQDGFYLSPDKKVYAEHGHQIDDTNRLPGWPVPFKMIGEQQYLIRPWGEQFVQSFYNDKEWKYSAIDNISGQLNGIKYGLASEGIEGSLNATGDFFEFFLLRQSFRQFADLLSDQGSDALAPEWDFDQVRAKGDRFLVESIPSDDPIRELAEAALAAGKLGVHLAEFTNPDIQRLCDYRYSLLQTQLDQPAASRTIERCPAKNLRALAKKVVSLFDEHRIVSDYIDLAYDNLINNRRLQENELFDLVVLSHTHQVDDFNPREGSHRDWQPRVMNTGAWQRIATLEYVLRLKKNNRWKNQQILRELTLSMLPECYPAVVVQPYGTTPKGELRYWRKTAIGGWTLSRTPCSSPQPPPNNANDMVRQ